MNMISFKHLLVYLNGHDLSLIDRYLDRENEGYGKTLRRLNLAYDTTNDPLIKEIIISQVDALIRCFIGDYVDDIANSLIDLEYLDRYRGDRDSIEILLDLEKGLDDGSTLWADTLNRIATNLINLDELTLENKQSFIDKYSDWGVD